MRFSSSLSVSLSLSLSFSSTYIQKGNEEKAALALCLSLASLRFSATFLLRFRSLPLLRFAERISLVYSIVKIEMIDFDSILSSFFFF